MISGSAAKVATMPTDGAGEREHEALGHQLRDQLPRRRTEGDADGDLFFARQRARQQQRGDVQHADDEQQRDRAEQHHQRRPVVAELFVEQRHQPRVPALVGARVLQREAIAERIDRALRLLEGRARREPRDRFHEMRGATVLREVPSHALPDVDVIRIMELRRHHADHEVGRVVERDRLADDRRIAAESSCATADR